MIKLFHTLSEKRQKAAINDFLDNMTNKQLKELEAILRMFIALYSDRELVQSNLRMSPISNGIALTSSATITMCGMPIRSIHITSDGNPIIICCSDDKDDIQAYSLF